MTQYKLEILNIEKPTHDTLAFKTTKPENFQFTPGQATELAINLPAWQNEKRPFSFASKNSDDFLEFIIKVYEKNLSVTKKLLDLEQGNSFIMEEPWGEIQYKGPGVFIAGGAGITPFIAILRDLQKNNNLKNNTLIFSNKTEEDIILKEELDQMQDLKKIHTLTREVNQKFHHGRIDKGFLSKTINNFNQKFYICGPITMVGELQHSLKALGTNPESIVLES